MDQTVQQYAPGNTAKYTADYMHRAFGDSMMRWGVSSILIEAGGWYPERGGDDFVRRLFAMSLLRGLYAVAAAEDEKPSGAAYDQIPFDAGKQFYDVLLRGGKILNGQGRAPFRADLAINVNVRAGLPQEPLAWGGSIHQVGDLEDDMGKLEVDTGGKVLLPGYLAIAPSINFDGEVPASDVAAKFLRAGITTVACGYGPFASNRARENWMQAVSHKVPPINIIAFERVTSLAEIQRRHGMSELAGLLVQDLSIAPEDLLSFANLFHPVTMPDLGNRNRALLGLDVFFQASPSPSGGLLHIHLTHLKEERGEAPIRQDELRSFVGDLLRSPSQITLSMDAEDDPFDWLPIQVGYGGLSFGRLPAPNFLGKILRAVDARESGAITSALSLLAMQNSHAFRMGNVGTIQRNARADIVAYDEALLSGGEQAFEATPEVVISNGSVVYDAANGVQSSAAGAWSFAPSTPGRN